MLDRSAPKNIFLAKAFLDVLRGSDLGAFIQGELEDVVIDGHFDLVRVADHVLEAVRDNSDNFFSAERKAE